MRGKLSRIERSLMGFTLGLLVIGTIAFKYGKPSIGGASLSGGVVGIVTKAYYSSKKRLERKKIINEYLKVINL